MFVQMCAEKLDLSTMEAGLYLELLFAMGCALSGLLINKIGKFPIICKLKTFLNTFQFQNSKIKCLLKKFLFWLRLAVAQLVAC